MAERTATGWALTDKEAAEVIAASFPDAQPTPDPRLFALRAALTRLRVHLDQAVDDCDAAIAAEHGLDDERINGATPVMPDRPVTDSDPASPILRPPTDWDYWCPPEGTHPFSANVLFVGILERRGEESWPLLVAAVVPPLPSEPPSQNESMAKVVRDALAAGDWTTQDGLAAWMRAHGGPTFLWPEHGLDDTRINDEASHA